MHGFTTVFLKWFQLKFVGKDIKRTAKLFIIIYCMLFGKKLWKIGLFESNRKRRIFEGMLTIAILARFVYFC